MTVHFESFTSNFTSMSLPWVMTAVESKFSVLHVPLFSLKQGPSKMLQFGGGGGGGCCPGVIDNAISSVSEFTIVSGG
jgi:hypothetical protein